MIEILPCGDQAVLIDLPSNQVQALNAALRKAAVPGIIDIVPAANTVLLTLDTRKISLADAHRIVGSLTLDSGAEEGSGKVVEVPVTYTGEDLQEVANQVKMSVPELIDWHGQTQWIASFGGFAPGFMYLQPHHEAPLAVPRRTSPRTEIPAGSVALAGPFSAVYPKASPGGWQLIGHTDAQMWDTTRAQPSLIQPGDMVRFVQVEAHV